MYVRHEAVLSSQIEGTQSTLGDVLRFELTGATKARSGGIPGDVEEVVNYVAAMNEGLRRLQSLPLSLRLIREIHARLMRDVRGSDRQPGEFRKSPNWIGPSGCTLDQAEFVPPPPHEMMQALHNFEKFLHDQSPMEVLIHCGLAHAQFETIHPFLNGNGRVGRLLVTFMHCQRDVLRKPLLYLSYYLKAHRSQYYDRLMAVRHDGDWEGWLKFFLQGVFEVSNAATETARRIVSLREAHTQLVGLKARSAVTVMRLLDVMFRRPVLNIKTAAGLIESGFKVAASAMDQLEILGLVEEITGGQRNRVFRYSPYVALFDQQSLRLPSDATPLQTTQPEIDQ